MVSNEFSKLFKAAIKAEHAEIMSVPGPDRAVELHVIWKIPYIEMSSDMSVIKWFKSVLLPLGDLLDWNQQPQIDLLTKQVADKEKELKEVWEEYSQYKRLVQEARR